MAKTRKKSISELGSVASLAEVNAALDMALHSDFPVPVKVLMAQEYKRGWENALLLAKHEPAAWRKLVKEYK